MTGGAGTDQDGMASPGGGVPSPEGRGLSWVLGLKVRAVMGGQLTPE